MLNSILEKALSRQERWDNEAEFDRLPVKHQKTIKYAREVSEELIGRIDSQSAEILDEFINAIDDKAIDAEALRMLFSSLSSDSSISQLIRLACCELVVRFGMLIEYQKNK